MPARLYLHRSGHTRDHPLSQEAAAGDRPGGRQGGVFRDAREPARKYRNVVHEHDSPVVEFSVDGTTVRHKSDIEYGENTFEVDEIVHLLYDPSDPSRFHLEKGFRRLLSSGGTLIAVGIAWVVLSCVLVVLFIQ